MVIVEIGLHFEEIVYSLPNSKNAEADAHISLKTCAGKETSGSLFNKLGIGRF
jgi:hypothetical protein